MPRCLIALGSNLGPRQETLTRALGLIQRAADVRLLKHSGWHTTRPIGGPAQQEPYCNAAALLETSLSPQAVLALLADIESQLGRQRSERWASRTVDLDLLLYDRLVLDTPALRLPHPRMAFRRFVLEPAAEIAPAMEHPLIGWSIQRLLAHLNTAPNFVAITGGPATGKTTLARRLAARFSARLLLDEPPLSAPAGTAGQIELEFVRRRAGQLAADADLWRDQRLVVSDYWLDQSLAYATTRLAAQEQTAFAAQFADSAQKTVRPKLLVLLDAPGEELARRTGQSDPAGRAEASDEEMRRLCRAIADRAAAAGRGPLLRLTSSAPDEMLAEAAAAVEAMQ